MTNTFGETYSADDVSETLTFNEERHAPSWGRLLMIARTVRAYELNMETFTFGRSENNTVVSDIHISRKHFQICKTPDNPPTITDLSRNGTFLNGRRIPVMRPVVLNNNDIISVGPNATDFVYKDFHNNFLSENLQKKYEVLKSLGKGGFGEVRLVVDKTTCHRYAIKKVEKNRESKSNEIDILRKIEHPHIITFIDSVETPDNFFIIMQYMDGGHLGDFIHANDNNKRGLAEQVARMIFSQILKAVEYLHNLRIIHRDLKPPNILRKKGELVFKLADFGIGKILDEENSTYTVCGTRGFMAPEVLLKQPYGPAVDIWSMGALLYYMFSSQNLFNFSTCDGDLSKIIQENVKAKIFKLNVTSQAKDLMDNMVKTRYRRRLTIQEIINHPWIANNEREN